ncbi:amidohydrolase family protein [Actinophytocola oryzae]|uniref:Amidohydrolase family protein n=1 Tax=Actinophytocola oryzae TaxID=502181 RepID=A0A4R7W0Q7_9PSEU|nr:amidohydrolase family protein [Actinophytocola oryzae]TDV55972.1 amidohydrolase family protein [Actinophytocola oryzae]
MTVQATPPVSFYPPGGLGAPKDRRGHAAENVTGLPTGTEVFSADNHISLADDIFYERLPEEFKEKAPRVWYEDGAFELGLNGMSFLPGEFTQVLMQYDPLLGAGSGNPEARRDQLAADGVTRELAFPNALLALLFFPDKDLKERCFRIYNSYVAELQERSPGRFYGVGLINWWDGDGARRTLAELKSLGLRTFLLPLNGGQNNEGTQLDYSADYMNPVWEAIAESEVPIAHHIGEAPLSAPCEVNGIAVGMVHNVAPFREMFGRYVLGGILDRHPGLRVGWFEGGINWVLSALQDAEHMHASFKHMLNHQVEHDPRYYWDNNMYASFIVDPLGLQMIDKIGVDRVMWSSDYPHNESSYGYSEKSLAAVVDAVGPENAVKIVSGNIQKFLGL